MKRLWLCAVMLLIGCKGAQVAPAVQPMPTRAADYREREARGSETGRERRQERGDREEGEDAARPKRARPSEGAAAGQFDFYLLNLSWSPEFCATHVDSPECGRRLGFVLHGLWPQNLDGTYPEHCSDAAGPAGLGPLDGIVPTEGLLAHEWTTHGTCTGLSPAAWESAEKTAFTEVKIPAGFGAQDGMLGPDEVLRQFAGANPSFPAGSLALSCGNNRLTAIEVCMGKDLRPQACAGVRSCRANAVKITGR